MDSLNSARSMAFFAAGYAVIFTLMSVMYAHAIRKADPIGLSATEIRLTSQTVWRFRGEVIIALAVVVFAMFTPLGPFAGGLMILNWPNAYLTEAWVNRQYRRR